VRALCNEYADAMGATMLEAVRDVAAGFADRGCSTGEAARLAAAAQAEAAAARVLQGDSADGAPDVALRLLQYRRKTGHVYSTALTDLYSVADVHLSLTAELARAEGSVAQRAPLAPWLNSPEDAEQTVGPRLTLDLALRRGVTVRAARAVHEGFAEPLLAAVGLGGGAAAAKGGGWRLPLLGGATNKKPALIDDDRLLVALMNDCPQCGAHAEDLVGKHAAPLELLDDESGAVRVYGGGSDSSEEEGSDEEGGGGGGGGGGALGAAAAGGEGGGGDDCTLLSGRAWRRRREDAFARFEQTLVRVAGGAAAQLAAKMAEALAPMLTPIALFGADDGGGGGGGAPSSTAAGGATQRGRDSTIGEGSGGAALLPPMLRQASAHPPPGEKRRSGGGPQEAAEQHTYRREATGVIAQTLAEYLGEWGAACNDWAVGRLSGALGAALARGYLSALFGIPAAQGHGWGQSAHARPPSKLAVFSDYGMLLRCLSGETRGEAVAADAVEWTAWGALADDDGRPLPSERAAADSAAGRLARRRVRARAATAALEPLMHMMQALSVSEDVLEDGAVAVGWFSGLAQLYAPSREAPHLFAAVRAVLEMRCAAPHIAAAAAAEGGLPAAHAPPIPKPVVAAALAAIAASMEPVAIADAALANDASAASGGGGAAAAPAVGRQGVLRALFPNAVPDFATFRKKSAKQMAPKKPRWNKKGTTTTTTHSA